MSLIRAAEVANIAGMFPVRTFVSENVLSVTELADMAITVDAITDMLIAEPFAWVAVKDGNLIVFSVTNQEEGSLFAVFVLPSNKGRGVGCHLIEEVENHLFDRHAVCWPETGRIMRAAGFCRRLGWSSDQEGGS